MNELLLDKDVIFRPARPEDAAMISALSAGVFGPGRFARTAYRVREGTPPISPFCRVAEVGGQITAAVRLTEVTVGKERGAVLLGPLVVKPAFSGRGLGRRLVREALAEAGRCGIRLAVLVGDLGYYGRLGFEPVPAGRIIFPGPVDPARILAAGLQPGALAAFAGGLVRAVATRS